jgi:two-component system response regulator MprA
MGRSEVPNLGCASDAGARIVTRMAHRHDVMLVEDDRESRDALAAVLEAYGFQVREAVDGQDALDQLHAGYRPCAILLDLMMPRLDGWGFRDAQRVDPDLGRIPVALLTAAGNVRLQARRLEVEAAFSKPADLDGVLTFIEGHCAAALGAP